MKIKKITRVKAVNRGLASDKQTYSFNLCSMTGSCPKEADIPITQLLDSGIALPPFCYDETGLLKTGLFLDLVYIQFEGGHSRYALDKTSLQFSSPRDLIDRAYDLIRQMTDIVTTLGQR